MWDQTCLIFTIRNRGGSDYIGSGKKNCTDTTRRSIWTNNHVRPSGHALSIIGRGPIGFKIVLRAAATTASVLRFPSLPLCIMCTTLDRLRLSFSDHLVICFTCPPAHTPAAHHLIKLFSRLCFNLSRHRHLIKLNWPVLFWARPDPSPDPFPSHSSILAPEQLG